MRTSLPPLLVLLSPVLALAQDGGRVKASQSPAFWFWLVALAIAVAAFIAYSVALSKRRGGPPPGGPRTPRTT